MEGEEYVKAVMLDVCRSVEVLHELLIAHRDIKVENILVKDTEEGVEVKLADFTIGVEV